MSTGEKYGDTSAVVCALPRCRLSVGKQIFEKFKNGHAESERAVLHVAVLGVLDVAPITRNSKLCASLRIPIHGRVSGQPRDSPAYTAPEVCIAERDSRLWTAVNTFKKMRSRTRKRCADEEDGGSALFESSSSSPHNILKKNMCSILYLKTQAIALLRPPTGRGAQPQNNDCTLQQHDALQVQVHVSKHKRRCNNTIYQKIGKTNHNHNQKHCSPSSSAQT